MGFKYSSLSVKLLTDFAAYHLLVEDAARLPRPVHFSCGPVRQTADDIGLRVVHVCQDAFPNILYTNTPNCGSMSEI